MRSLRHNTDVLKMSLKHPKDVFQTSITYQRHLSDIHDLQKTSFKYSLHLFVFFVFCIHYKRRLSDIHSIQLYVMSWMTKRCHLNAWMSKRCSFELVYWKNIHRHKYVHRTLSLLCATSSMSAVIWHHRVALSPTDVTFRVLHWVINMTVRMAEFPRYHNVH